MTDRGLNQYEHQRLSEQPLKLVPYGEEFSEKRTVAGLIIPSGEEIQKFMLQKDVSGLVLGLWRKQLKARVFYVSGEMVFKVDKETYKEIPRPNDESDFWKKYDLRGGELS